MPQRTSPRPFSEIPGLWLQVFNMSEEFLAQEAFHYSSANTFIGVLILAFISAGLSMLSALIYGGSPIMGVPSEFREMGLPNIEGLGLFILCGGVLSTIVGFYFSNYICYYGARILGGKRRPRAQLYLQSLFAVPLGAVASLAGLIPYAGALIAFGLGLYMLMLDVRVVKVVHKFTTGRAVASILLLPLILPLVIFLIGIVGIACVVLISAVARTGNVVPK
jgi:hypothetical protein